ncbi:MAG: hypothetical protein ABIN97_09990 [Ginsengibacter sp.]
MKQISLLLAVFSLAMISCNKIELASVGQIPGLLDGKWRMITVKENASGFTSVKPPALQGEVEITFTSVSNINGTFTGNTPTNHIDPNNYIIGTTHSLTIPGLSMTKVMETPWGNEFVDNILNSQEYSFEIDGKLNIKTTNKTLTFQKL